MAVESKTLAKHGRQDGFTLLQVVIVVLVIAVVGGMAVFGIVQARQRIRLTNSARLLASYLEKARVDSIRRGRSSPTAEAVVSRTTHVQVRILPAACVKERSVS